MTKLSQGQRQIQGAGNSSHLFIWFFTKLRVEVSDLPPETLQELRNQLELPAFPSMRNWETVAASLGLTNDSIMVTNNLPSACSRLAAGFALPCDERHIYPDRARKHLKLERTDHLKDNSSIVFLEIQEQS